MDIRQFAKNIRYKSEKFAEVASACHSLLKHSESAARARAYIYKRLSKNSINKFKIGYFPKNDNIDELISLVGEDTLNSLGLLKYGTINNRSHIDKLKLGYLCNHNIIFPFKDEYGNIIALAGRTLLSEEKQKELLIPKYKNTVFSKSMHLYGLYNTKGAIEKNKCAIIVEGQIDCINCHAHGYFNTVALTCSELTLYQLYTLKKMTSKIYLLLDNDDAGKKATQKAINKYSRFIDIEPLKLPKLYKDVDQYLLSAPQHDIFNVCYNFGGV